MISRFLVSALTAIFLTGCFTSINSELLGSYDPITPFPDKSLATTLNATGMSADELKDARSAPLLLLLDSTTKTYRMIAADGSPEDSIQFLRPPYTTDYLLLRIIATHGEYLLPVKLNGDLYFVYGFSGGWGKDEQQEMDKFFAAIGIWASNDAERQAVWRMHSKHTERLGKLRGDEGPLGKVHIEVDSQMEIYLLSNYIIESTHEGIHVSTIQVTY